MRILTAARIALLVISCLASGYLSADEWAGDIPVGEPLPAFELQDQHGKTWTEKSIAGSQGTAFFFVRSTVW